MSFKRAGYSPSPIQDPDTAWSMAQLEDRHRAAHISDESLTEIASQFITAERFIPSPEAVQLLEEADIEVEDKVTLLLASMGEKPATWVVLQSDPWQLGEPFPAIPLSEIDRFDHIVSKLGLKAHTIDWFFKQGSDVFAVRDYMLSRSADVLAVMVHAIEDSNYDRALGKVLGYPETATQAFLERRSTTARGIGEQDIVTRAFARYALSPENAQAELEVARRWADAVKSMSPRIYRQCIDETAAAIVDDASSQ